MNDTSVTVMQERVVKDGGSPNETLDVSYHFLRKELDAMRAEREKEAIDRREELCWLECLFTKAKKSLQQSLSER